MDFKRLTDSLVQQTKTYFESNGFFKAIIGISGGKDSTVCAKLMVETLGSDNVYAFSFPLNEVNENVFNKHMRVVDATGLNLKNSVIMSIDSEMNAFTHNTDISEQARINLQPRIRMAKLYMMAQSIGKALVINTSNLDERYVGYSTIWGDSVGDFAPIQELHVSEVIEVGRTLGLPDELLFIPPSDGLSGKTDEDNLGFSYKEVEGFINKIQVLFKKSELGALKAFDSFLKDARELTGEVTLDSAFYTEHEQKILDCHRKNLFKWNAIHLAGCKKEN